MKGVFPHIKLEGGFIRISVKCEHCGDEHQYSVPRPLDEFLAEAKRFVQRHKTCIKPLKSSQNQSKSSS